MSIASACDDFSPNPGPALVAGPKNPLARKTRLGIPAAVGTSALRKLALWPCDHFPEAFDLTITCQIPSRLCDKRTESAHLWGRTSQVALRLKPFSCLRSAPGRFPLHSQPCDWKLTASFPEPSIGSHVSGRYTLTVARSISSDSDGDHRRRPHLAVHTAVEPRLYIFQCLHLAA